MWTFFKLSCPQSWPWWDYLSYLPNHGSLICYRVLEALEDWAQGKHSYCSFCILYANLWCKDSAKWSSWLYPFRSIIFWGWLYFPVVCAGRIASCIKQCILITRCCGHCCSWRWASASAWTLDILVWNAQTLYEIKTFELTLVFVCSIEVVMAYEINIEQLHICTIWRFLRYGFMVPSSLILIA